MIDILFALINCVLRSRREIIRNLEQVEQAVQDLVSASPDAVPDVEGLHQLALAHLQFGCLNDETGATLSDLLYQLYLQDAFPKPLGPPGQEIPKYKPQSELRCRSDEDQT